MSQEKGEKSVPLWTQKFGCSEILDENYLSNALSYVKNNRTKHNLPDHSNKGFKALIEKISCEYSYAFREEYTGGFDVVIGNPPYVRQELLGNVQKEYFSKKYIESFNYSADLYVYFYNLSMNILKKDGLLGFITPNKWMERKYGFELREYLKSFNILQIINYGELRIFDDAATEPEITIIKNEINSKSDIQYAMIKSLYHAQNHFYDLKLYKKELLSQSIWKFTDSTINNILEKFNDSKITLNEYTNGGIYYGIKTGLNEAFIINQSEKNKIIEKDLKSDLILKKMVEGDDFKSWSLNHSGRHLIASEYNLDVKNLYPAVFEYLNTFKEKLIKRQDKGLNYWNLRACDYYDKLEQPKLIYYHTAIKHSFYYDKEGYYISANCYFISNADRYLQCVLNSKLFNFVKKFLFPAFGDSENGGRVRLDANKMIKLPIKEISDDLKFKFLNFAELITVDSNNLQEQSQKFQRTLQRKFFSDKGLQISEKGLQPSEKGFQLSEKGLQPSDNGFQPIAIAKKLQNWYLLSYSDFIKELTKQKVKLSLSQEAEWEEYFTQEATKVLAIKNKIDSTDKAIDSMVYELYGLTSEEIAIVESSN